MRLTDRHILYEANCRKMFVGQVICAVVYGELKYYLDKYGNNVNPEPFYKTQYPDIDTLDYSIYFKTLDKAICVFWDNSFISYGLQSSQLYITESTNNHEQKWDVSTDEKWLSIIGQKIIEFKIIWEETWVSNLDGSDKTFIVYPQTFEIKVDNGKRIIISASEFTQGDGTEIYTLMDNLLVTTNSDLARQLKIIK